MFVIFVLVVYVIFETKFILNNWQYLFPLFSLLLFCFFFLFSLFFKCISVDMQFSAAASFSIHVIQHYTTDRIYIKCSIKYTIYSINYSIFVWCVVSPEPNSRSHVYTLHIAANTLTFILFLCVVHFRYQLIYFPVSDSNAYYICVEFAIAHARDCISACK